jgi:acyl carrier protein
MPSFFSHGGNTRSLLASMLRAAQWSFLRIGHFTLRCLLRVAYSRSMRILDSRLLPLVLTLACGAGPKIIEPPPPPCPATLTLPAPSASDSKTLTKVRQLTSHTLHVEEGDVRLDSHFINDLGADNLNMVELQLALEEEFTLDIPDSDMCQLATVGNVVAYIEKAKQSTPPESAMASPSR